MRMKGYPDFKYQAIDGTEFSSKEECQVYEEELNKGPLKKFNLWLEGYLATGMEGIPARAQCLARDVEGKDFIDAVKRWLFNYQV